MRVLAIVAHPDDELMCAGTLARFAAEGHETWTAPAFDYECPTTRSGEATRCAEALGATCLPLLAPNENELRVNVEWVHEFETLVADVRADLIISHRPDDTNQTHATLGQIMRTVCRKNDRTLWQMDQSIPGGIDTTSRRPNHFVNITDHDDAKQEAVACYKSQLDRYPADMAEAIHHRDAYYGWLLAQDHPAVTLAEGFIVEKSVWL